MHTLLSHDPAIRKFCWRLDGLKDKAEIESSGGEVTSKSFIGLAVEEVTVGPKVLDVFNPPPVNICWNKAEEVK